MRTKTQVLKESLHELNGMKSIPQKSTITGLFLIIQQLGDKLSGINVGEFINNLTLMTYGDIINSYSPILVGIVLLVFNEDKFFERYK